MRLMFWCNTLSPHQSSYTRELATENEVVVVALNRIGEERRSLGWTVPDFGTCKVVVGPSQGECSDLLKGERQAIHLLEGFHGSELSRFVLRHAPMGARIGVLSEDCDKRGWRGVGRRVRCGVDVLRNRRKVDFVLAMGASGVNWYRRCGLSQAKIYPFCYVVEPFSAFGHRELGKIDGSEFRLMYLGQFIERKAVDVLVQALACLGSGIWCADLVGSGPMEGQIRSMVQALGLSGRIRMNPVQLNATAMQMLASADLLVLPSHYDGWGAVVNEALSLGVPVICSSGCGAADLIRHDWLGSVVSPGSVPAMHAALANMLQRGRPTPSDREKIRDWARCIGGPSIASYFTTVVNHVYHGGVLPRPPWRLS